MTAVPDRTFAAVVLGWYGAAVPDPRAGTVRLSRLLEQLSRAGVEVVLISSAGIAQVARQLAARPPGPGGVSVLARDGGYHLSGGAVVAMEPPPANCERVGPLAQAADLMALRGIGSGLILVVAPGFGADGDRTGADIIAPAAAGARSVLVCVGRGTGCRPPGVLCLGGGPATTRRLMSEQVARHRHGALADVDEDPRWLVSVATPPTPRRVAQALTTVADGHVGTRGSGEQEGSGSGASVLLGGIYHGIGADQHLLGGPLWTVIGPAGAPDGPAPATQTLDLRTGLLLRRADTDGAVQTSLRFASASRSSLVAMRAQGPATRRAGGPLSLPDEPGPNARIADDRRSAQVVGDPGVICAVGTQRRWTSTGRLERLAVYACGEEQEGLPERLDQARRDGFGVLVAEQRETWARRWADAQPDLPDDPAAEKALRFALFHLLASAPATGEAAVGARGLSGPGYCGHVFWDADVFVLPVLAAVRPAAARAMLEYRVRRLDPALARAGAEGRRGARFPWESAESGADATPRSAQLGDQVTPVCTGELEVHIVADIAWAAWRYTEWSGDEAFLAGAGRPLLLETARYWASRAQADRSGRAHINGVIGPDEYHVGVDDDAFTNVMARWNLRCAAGLVRAGGSDSERAEAAGWLTLADALVDGYDGVAGRHEQFAGFDRLEPVLISEIAHPPVAADILLGGARVAQAQVIKQADVMMAHHLVPSQLPAGSLQADLAYYGPRTAHGSSLSPAVHAALLARAGRPQEALHWFQVAAAIDLDDLSGMGGSGLHMAAMGGLWQAFAQGFLGLVPTSSGLRVDPKLPPQWPRAGLRFRFHGSRVRLTVDGSVAVVESDLPIRLLLPDGTVADTRRKVLSLGADGWTMARDRKAGSPRGRSRRD